MARRKKNPVVKLLARPMTTAKRKALAAVRRKSRAAMKRASPKRAVKRRAKARVHRATHQRVTCRVCGREVKAVLRHGQWQVGPHNKPTSHTRCGGVVVSGHRRAQ